MQRKTRVLDFKW